jgi:predicted glycogen debranching enzyme
MKLPAITFNREAFSCLSDIIEKEWLITNGAGSYAATTMPGINTRKYHGLFVAALHPPRDRTVCLAKLDEDIMVNNEVYRLGTNEFANLIFPEGYKFAKQFSISPFPTYIYDADNITLSKTIFIPRKKNVVSIIYKVDNKNDDQCIVRIYPILTCRYFHTVIDRYKIPLNFNQKSDDKKFEVSFERPQATIVCTSTEGSFKEKINWIDRLHYREEALRGESNVDDCFQPGYFNMQVPAKTEKEFAITVAVNHDSKVAMDDLNSYGNTIQVVNETFNHEIYRKLKLLNLFYDDHQKAPMSDWLNWILMAADSFIVETLKGRKAIIAGYFWFEPWGRDSFISLPGLMLVTGRFQEAKELLQDFMKHCKEGLIPNFLSDKTGVPVYNTVDGTLWYINSVLQYLKYTADLKFVKDMLWENLKSIVEFHEKGTFFDIVLDNDNLIIHGPRLTWMDAVAAGEQITPRGGKAVEIQALWYNTLRTMEVLAKKFGENSLAEKYLVMADKTKKSFIEKFWNSEKKSLIDVLEAEGKDTSLRCNQIIAVSLDFNMLDIEKNKHIVDVVNRELVTPYGLRTLALNDPKFVGKCMGNRRSRDTAYHNGTIWPWLLGPFVTAYLKVNEYNEKYREFALKNFIIPLFSLNIHQAGLGTISEIFDCDSPNVPRGCIAQAWSVAEPLRAYIEDVLGVQPKYQKDFSQLGL